ncbi:hypothetical protein GCM10009623_34640 [Nocardioides aestuarii]|uniref:Phage integrase central domain-containing protein n=1 Tax=Nocardioides aestuarii TaxID=252231 RepID=A0ABW4TSY0_9ACTN
MGRQPSADPAGLLLVSPSGRVRATPPAAGTRYWRLSIVDGAGHRIRQTTGGTTRASAERALLELDRHLAAHSPAGARARHGAELLRYYLDDRRPKNQSHPDRSPRWSQSYTDQTRHLVNHYLCPVLASTPLAEWSAEHAFAVLDRCPTNYMVSKVRRTLSAVLTLGVADGFLRSDQRDLHRVTVPLRPDVRPRRREPPARLPDASVLLRPDEVPSTAQVEQLAASTPPCMEPRSWEGVVNFLAYTGVRIGEALGCADRDVLDDLPTGLIAVRWQLIEPVGQSKRLAPPKNGYGRLVAVCEETPLGFPLRSWLLERAEVAAQERVGGHNPAGALLVTPRGRWWTRSNFRARCFNPAATAAGWERLSWRGPVRRKVAGRWVTTQAERHDWRHPLHSLRHHYACTARDMWGWTGAELCLNGGWADEAFVHSRYYGASEETYRRAVAKQAGTSLSGRLA